jgi:hypothetical protein
MDFQAEQTLRAELGRGERLLWSGRPRQGVRLRASDGFMVPFSLLWGGFAIFWEAMALRQSKSPLFVLWGIPFVLIGIYLIVGRFFVDSYQRARTYYGVTDQRVLILSGLFTRRTTSIALQNLGEVSVAERSDRSGSIVFGVPHATHTAWWGGGGEGKAAPMFDLVDDVRQIYNAVRDAQQSALQRGRT